MACEVAGKKNVSVVALVGRLDKDLMLDFAGSGAAPLLACIMAWDEYNVSIQWLAELIGKFLLYMS